MKMAVFGTGPIQGFATTLIIGIITSLITSIFITRLYFEGRLAKNKNITFEGQLTRKFLTNTHFDFIGMRKYTYVLAAAVIAVYRRRSERQDRCSEQAM